MPRIDRKIKREMARVAKARNAREQAMVYASFEKGVEVGKQVQQAKIQYATIGMGYLYEYPVEGTPYVGSIDISRDGAIRSTIAGLVNEQPDADALPA